MPVEPAKYVGIFDIVKFEGGPGNAAEILDWLTATGGSGFYQPFAHEIESDDAEGTMIPEQPEYLYVNTSTGPEGITAGKYVVRDPRGAFYTVDEETLNSVYFFDNTINNN